MLGVLATFSTLWKVSHSFMWYLRTLSINDTYPFCFFHILWFIFNRLLGLEVCQTKIKVGMVTERAGVTSSEIVKTEGGMKWPEGISQNKSERGYFLNAGYVILRDSWLGGFCCHSGWPCGKVSWLPLHNAGHPFPMQGPFSFRTIG